MALHKDLTGAELHEPKGADTASAGDVYVANGSGSGTWENRYSDVIALNEYWLTGQMDDISTPTSHVYFTVPVKSEAIATTTTTTSNTIPAGSVVEIRSDGGSTNAIRAYITLGLRAKA
jgi:hypothetical protein